MNERLESILIDYIEGNLSESERQAIELELTKDEDTYKRYEQLKKILRVASNVVPLEPSLSLSYKFHHLLQEEIDASKKSKIIFQPRFYRIAAAIALLIIGGGAGFWISKSYHRQVELAVTRKEIEATKLALMSMLDNQQSASQRVLGASVAYRMDKLDDEVVSTLVMILNEDPNTNVRLAALEALCKFRSQKHIRRALITSLKKQNDPTVQIILIRLLVEMKEKSATQELERITTDDETLPAVKDEAHAGLLRLS